MLTEAATKLTYEDVFAEKRSEWENAAEIFGLKDPAVTATVRFTDRTDVTVHIGKSADPENNSYYYMSVDGDERLYAVSAGITEDLTTEKALLHPVPRLPAARPDYGEERGRKHPEGMEAAGCSDGQGRGGKLEGDGAVCISGGL